MPTSSTSDEKLHEQDRTTPSVFKAGFARLKTTLGFKNQKELADILEIRQSSISDAKRRDVIPADWAIKLLRKERINPHWIYVGMHPMRIGDPQEAPRCDSFAGQSSFLQKFATKSLSIIVMQDASMEPEIPRDSHVGINIDDRELVSGALYGVNLPYEGFTVRRIVASGGLKATLRAENRSIPAITVDHARLGAILAGRAVWIRSCP
ncbi:MAG: helix-turn-helix domain-containing protein [Acidobacteriota bacterium]